MDIVPIVIGCGVLILTARALLLGAASANGQGITREDEPLAYWLCVAGGIVITCFLFYDALRGFGQ